jgi:sugar lactone lactonase YvrE
LAPREIGRSVSLQLPRHPPIAIGPSCVLGEAPIWDPLSAKLSWVDCDQRQLFRLEPDSGAIETFQLTGAPGSYASCPDGRLLLAYRNRLALVDLETGAEQPIDTPMVDFAQARFNDGACDRAGRFWLGTMHKSMSEPVGALYRVDADLSVHPMAADIIISNGIAFSPDDTVLYHTDSRLSTIYAYAFDIENGTIADRRIFASFSEPNERPDGCTVDAQGNLWVAMLGGGRIAVLDPSGREIDSLPLPTTRPTSLCFGGRSLDTLYVTTMTYALSAEERAAQPDAGRLFAFPGIGQGLPEPGFGAS